MMKKKKKGVEESLEPRQATREEKGPVEIESKLLHLIRMYQGKQEILKIFEDKLVG